MRKIFNLFCVPELSKNKKSFVAIKDDMQSKIETLQTQIVRILNVLVLEEVTRENDDTQHIAESLRNLEQLSDRIKNALNTEALILCLNEWNKFIAETFTEIYLGVDDCKAYLGSDLSKLPKETQEAFIELSREDEKALTVQEKWLEEINTQLKSLNSATDISLTPAEAAHAKKYTQKNLFGRFFSHILPTTPQDSKESSTLTLLFSDSVADVLKFLINGSNARIEEKAGITHFYKGLISIATVGDSEPAFQVPVSEESPEHFVSFQKALEEHAQSKSKSILDFALIENVINHFTWVSVEIDPKTKTVHIYQTDTLSKPATGKDIQKLIEQTVKAVFSHHRVNYQNITAPMTQHDNTCGDRTVAAIATKYNPISPYVKNMNKEIKIGNEEGLRVAFLDCEKAAMPDAEHNESVRSVQVQLGF